MSRHLLDRPFDQERFDELKREAQTLRNTLKITKVTPGRIHSRNMLYIKLGFRISSLEKHGEHYHQSDDRPLSSNRRYYTLDTLEDMIGKARKFLKGG